MIHLIDIAVFAFSFFIFLVVNYLLQGRRVVDDKKIKLEQKLNELARQQANLLETSLDRVSTFAKTDDFGVAEYSDRPFLSYARSFMRKGGINNISIHRFIHICAISGLIMTILLIYLKFLNFISGVLIGIPTGAGVAYNVLSFLSNQSKMEFLKIFPDAIDMMIRGVKAGLNIGRVIKLVSIESKEPIASEFKSISQRFDLGIRPEKVLAEASEKIDIEEFRFLTVALILQMENGGVLVEILQNLSGIIRRRLELELKLKAMSAEARMSAVIISVLPFVFAGIMAVVNPEHLTKFTEPGSGQNLLKSAVALFLIGLFAMIKATQLKI
ncbi:MAG: type II secretion system F family protein [Holosporaceae bacterium]|jgi:tight adherence protein B|nr:type II secretion system F family protein [Holosporaceae bacterium]